MMSSPRMSRRPGGAASVKLYEDYERYLREGPPPGLTHAAVGKPVKLAAPPDPRYPGGGAQGLVDNVAAVDDYCDTQWMGYYGNDLEAVIDLGEPLEITSLGGSLFPMYLRGNLPAEGGAVLRLRRRPGVHRSSYRAAGAGAERARPGDLCACGKRA
jgi:hypothetical protein